uniref:Putative DNA polymerase of type B n=1 Tax=Treubaria triappendiculata TaxID=1755147 RepID=A0A0S2LMS0_TRETR|nr:putative DNA polymerase of type B [Treubaria triappendiculata]ALO62683.1 putative DNA polymerase of type B [Treubaria triappendiculata]
MKTRNNSTNTKFIFFHDISYADKKDYLNRCIFKNNLCCYQNLQKNGDLGGHFFDFQKISYKNQFSWSLVILDIELTGSQFLIGLFFVHSNEYVYFLFDRNVSQPIFHFMIGILKGFFYRLGHLNTFSKDYTFEEDQDNVHNFNSFFQEEKSRSILKPGFYYIQPMLITYNGKSYDLPILNAFLYGIPSKNAKTNINISDSWIYKENWESPKDRLSWIYKISDEMINNPTSLKFQLYSFSKWDHNRNIAHIDVLLYLKNEQEVGFNSKSNALSVQKIKLFLDAQNEKLFVEAPKEFDDEVIEKGGYEAEISPENFKKWVAYNFNDLYYTCLLFVNTPNIHNYIQSVFLFYNFYPIKKYTFCQAQNLKEIVLGSQYLQEKIILPEKKTYEKITLEDLIILGEYPQSFPIYSEFFKNVNYLKHSEKKEHEFKNILLCFSLGGLHSKFQNESYLFFTSDDEMIYLDLDVRSYYVEILKQLLERSDLTDFRNTFTMLADRRNVLKKEKNPLSNILKLMTLSITGNLQNCNSYFYNPILYYSMTLNGQLFLAQVLLELEEFIERVLNVNTDGFSVGILKKNEKEFKTRLNAIAEKYQYVFDTQDDLKSGLILNVNQYIYVYPDDKKKEKGFTEGNFNILLEYLYFYLIQENGHFNFDLILKNLSAFFKAYDFEKNIYNFLGYQKLKQKRTLYYFSKNPKSFHGLHLSGYIYNREFPVNSLKINELENVSSNNICVKISKDLDFLS